MRWVCGQCGRPLAVLRRDIATTYTQGSRDLALCSKTSLGIAVPLTNPETFFQESLEINETGFYLMRTLFNVYDVYDVYDGSQITD